MLLFFLSLEHIWTVLCLQGSGLIMTTQQVVSWTDCVNHTFISLLQTFYWLAPPWYFPSCWVEFLYFLPGRIQWMCCVGKRLPLYHLTMLCCHVAYLGKKKKVFLVDRSGVVNSVLKVAFRSLCRRKRRFFKKCFVSSFHCSIMFIFFTQSDGGCGSLFHFDHHY